MISRFGWGSEMMGNRGIEESKNRGIEESKNRGIEESKNRGTEDAINEIDNVLALQIAEALPKEINGLAADEGETTNAGIMGMMGGGSQINKRYQNAKKPENLAELVILANAPMVNAMNMYLTNPSMMGPEYKSVRGSARLRRPEAGGFVG